MKISAQQGINQKCYDNTLSTIDFPVMQQPLNKCARGAFEMTIPVFEENFDRAQWQTTNGEWLGMPDQIR